MRKFLDSVVFSPGLFKDQVKHLKMFHLGGILSVSLFLFLFVFLLSFSVLSCACSLAVCFLVIVGFNSK